MKPPHNCTTSEHNRTSSARTESDNTLKYGHLSHSRFPRQCLGHTVILCVRRRAGDFDPSLSENYSPFHSTSALCHRCTWSHHFDPQHWERECENCLDKGEREVFHELGNCYSQAGKYRRGKWHYPDRAKFCPKPWQKQ